MIIQYKCFDTFYGVMSFIIHIIIMILRIKIKMYYKSHVTFLLTVDFVCLLLVYTGTHWIGWTERRCCK